MSARLVLTATAGLGLGLLGACSSVAAGNPAANNGSPTPVAVPRQAAAALGTVKLTAAEVAGLGQVLTDANGKTLYRFAKDTATPPTSTCDGACAAAWPPLTVQGSDAVQINGIGPKLVGTVKRADGTEQVTIGGWPAYRYAKDTAPGQANGHAVGGVWFEFESNGCKVAAGKKPLTTTTSSSSSAAPGTAANSGGSGY
jgi:predicted lipoprotein with Yx(FWY)xxD motif